MSRASYCREQARICRELAAKISNTRDAGVLHNMALSYEAEADGLDRLEQAQPSPAPAGKELESG
jgi:hypothetical protein